MDTEAPPSVKADPSEDGATERVTSLKAKQGVLSPYLSGAYEYVAERAVKVQTGGMWRAAFLFITSISTASVLGMPYAWAQLTWTGGAVVNVCAAVGSWYATYHMASLFHYKGGRHLSYTDMAGAVLDEHGKWGRYAVQVLQYSVQIGVVICNLIQTASICYTIYQSYCPGPLSECPMLSNSYWTAIAAAALWCVCMIPDLSRMDYGIFFGSVCFLFFTVVAMILSGIKGTQDRSKGFEPEYQPQGSSADVAFSAFNALGMVAFMYGDTILPDIQATLADDPKTGNTVRPMMRGATIAHFIFAPIYFVLGIMGFWAFGILVPATLVSPGVSPRWLQAWAGAAACLQLLFTSQVYGSTVFEATEIKVMASLPRQRWMHRQVQSKDGGKARVPSALLILVVRTLILALCTLFAAALPFFSSIMGLIGAVGVGPLTYVLPAVLVLLARGKEMPRWQWWFDFSFAAVWGGTCLIAAVGAMQQIIVTASTWEFWT